MSTLTGSIFRYFDSKMLPTSWVHQVSLSSIECGTKRKPGHTIWKCWKPGAYLNELTYKAQFNKKCWPRQSYKITLTMAEFLEKNVIEPATGSLEDGLTDTNKCSYYGNKK